MADGNAMADIRGLDVDKLVKGFADELLVLKKFCRVTPTKAREIRWFQKTAGFLDSTDSSGMTASLIGNTAFKALPVVVEPTWTRNTSYVRKYFVESPTLTEEDIKDTDVDILATNIRDLVKAVAYQVEKRIYNVISDTVTSLPADGTSVPSAAATADGWDDDATSDVVTDILAGLESIRTYNYDINNVTMLLHPTDYKNLLRWLINVKGSSIPSFASDKVQSGVLTKVLGVNIVVSTTFTTDYAVMFVPQVTATWKQFMPISSAVINDPGIGRKVRVWEEGECLLTDPNSAYVITDTQV